MKLKFEREIIFQSGSKSSTIFRSKVIGGWLIEVLNFNENGNQVTSNSALEFISDTEHKWEICNC